MRSQAKDVSSPISRRNFLKTASYAAMAACAGMAGCRSMDEPVQVGILHSLSGTMAISEAALRDAAMLAIEEINQAGGLLGRSIVPIVEDSASDLLRFQDRAEKLLVQDKVCSIFGCWTSASRKAVLPVLEKHNGLLWYPVQYEGNECSRNVIYTGSTPSQQIIPALTWLQKQGRRRFYLLGSDYIFPRIANQIVRLHLHNSGGTVVGEQYVPLGSRDFAASLKEIRMARPDVVFSTINGDGNRGFYKQFREAGITAKDLPVMAMSLAEAEVRSIGTALTEGHLASWSYFQSVDTPENRRFVAAFKDRYGDRRVTDDPIEAAYFQVHLWASAVAKAGSTETDAIRAGAAGQKYSAPQGPVFIDARNRHTWKMARIGEIQANGQFNMLYSSPEPLRPDPWEPALNSGRNCEWGSGKTS